MIVEGRKTFSKTSGGRREGRGDDQSLLEIELRYGIRESAMPLLEGEGRVK